MKTIYICPKCGHEFEQGEWNYNYDHANLEFECPECDWTGTDSTVEEYKGDADMKSEIIDSIIFDAGSVENLVTLQQEWESDEDYKDRIYTEANDLFMDAVEELGFDELDEEDNAPYDEIRDEAIQEIMDMLMYGKTPYEK